MPCSRRITSIAVAASAAYINGQFLAPYAGLPAELGTVIDHYFHVLVLFPVERDHIANLHIQQVVHREHCASQLYCEFDTGSL